MALALAFAACLLLLVGLYPFGPYQLSLMLARRLHTFPQVAPREPAGAETFAICLCVHNEERVIRNKVKDLLALREVSGGDLSIMIYVDGASDGTTEILRSYGDRITLVVSSERRGKTQGMNLLVSRTSASIVMFTDANVLIGGDAVAVLRTYFADPTVGCVCSDLNYDNGHASETATVGAAYWRFNEWTKGLETDTGSVIGADGALFAIRRSLHRPVPAGLFDDIYLSLGVLFAGYRVVRAPELKAYETHTTEARDEFRRKVRIACECMHVHFALWPEIKRLPAWHLYKYLGHRLARWLSPWFLATSALTLLAASALVFGPLPAAIIAGSGVGLFGAALKLGVPPAARLWNVILAFAGTGIGVGRALMGHRAVTWSVPTSARSLPDIQR
jgi:cellulose synthase/poly-beta-1,6-N-acetylglucosamine synthase-like glycosyltransferase